MVHNVEERVYIGIPYGNWKQGLYNHIHSFSYRRLTKQTTLSKYFWNLKDRGLNPQIKLKIVRQYLTGNSFNGRYNWCIDEQINIINFKDLTLLHNERNELAFNCRHKSKLKLSWLGATKAPTLKKKILILDDFIGNNNISFGNYWYCMTGRDLCREGDSWKFRY